MSGVGAFINLYHVWGLFGLVTAVTYGLQAYKEWRYNGGKWRAAPGEWFYAFAWFSRETIKDLGRLVQWMAQGFLGLPFDWRQTEWRSRTYSRLQVILLGITLGGVSRFLTAIYWSERNREWMGSPEACVLEMAAAPIFLAVLGDLHHHLTAWPERKHRVRLLAFVGLAWILFGAIGG